VVFQMPAPPSANSAVTLAEAASPETGTDAVSSFHWPKNGDEAGCWAGADMAGADAITTAIIARGIFISRLLPHWFEETAHVSTTGRLAPRVRFPRGKGILES
jgi:hypothetical protein